MEWIELNNMEYGECIVLGGKKGEILMVDCGSVNQHIRDGNIPMDLRIETIANRYRRSMDRYFLLTHFHRDHLSGFQKLLEQEDGYFTRVFLPCTPMDENGNAPLLDFALFASFFLLPQTDSFQVNTSCVRIFRKLSETLGFERIFTLQAGDEFTFDDINYQVLWPDTEDFPFEPELLSAVEALNILFSSPFLPDLEKEFLREKEQFISLYLDCCQAFSMSGRLPPEDRRDALENLNQSLSRLEAMKEALNLSPLAHDVREILQAPQNTTAYSNTVNAASIVFHNLREKEAGFDDILMTGDVTPEVLESLSDQLFDGYNILKAPHHGTASGFCRMFRDMAIAHVLISNGEYHAGGAIAQEYIDLMDTVRHCTNHSPCKWFQASGACCNRLTCCYDQSPSGLTLKCPAVTKLNCDAPCHIRTLSPSCLCDSPCRGGRSRGGGMNPAGTVGDEIFSSRYPLQGGRAPTGGC